MTPETEQFLDDMSATATAKVEALNALGLVAALLLLFLGMVL